MKVITKTGILSFILILIMSCSSNDESITDEPITPEKATINSYSENYGYSGENIIIRGTNFTNKVDKVKVLFDNTEAEINSVNNLEIDVKLPIISNTIPVLKIEIENRIIINNVDNKYNGNIGILPNSINQWHSIDFNISDDRIWRTQTINRNKAYFSLNDNGGGGQVYRTIDGGLSWERWAPVGFNGTFHATSNDEGWSDFSNLNRIPVGGSDNLNFIFDNPDDINSGIIATYVNNNMQNGTIITSDKVVYQTIDGINFNETYNNSSGNIELSHFFAIDNNHIWAGGRSSDSNKPLLLFLDDGIWTEVEINLPGDNVKVTQIQFISQSIGFIQIFSPTTGNKLCKTIDGGNTWQIISDDFEYGAFSFKNETRGWCIKDKEIFSTTDGGTTWTLEYTNTSNFKNISYNDNVVWAISQNKVLKYFTE
ncbi:IPT/TIG domain-containing protein [Aquimarina hainanensis]|uniref:IPT/TIG domain-containing protein n=1 Tax=Aquimarina hainanensis TaxID=1578017 RepID=A0ABW5N3V8_9FLAO